MNTIYLLRHSLTAANEQRLYGGSTDSPLTERGRAIARDRYGVIPACDIYVSSGMARASETLLLMTGHVADLTLPGLREMDFGAFEMKSYEQLKEDPDYLRWIGDEAGEVRCPGGENMSTFKARALSAGETLLHMAQFTACVVCHGGVIVSLMQAWFPAVQRHFYEWQPGPCAGYRIAVEGGAPVDFEEV